MKDEFTYWGGWKSLRGNRDRSPFWRLALGACVLVAGAPLMLVLHVAEKLNLEELLEEDNERAKIESMQAENEETVLSVPDFQGWGW